MLKESVFNVTVSEGPGEAKFDVKVSVALRERILARLERFIGQHVTVEALEQAQMMVDYELREFMRDAGYL